MQIISNKNNYMRFLKDDKFIEWKLLSTDELNAYWADYLLKHPQDREDIMLAEKHFQNIDLSYFHLLPARKKETWLQIEDSIRRHDRKKKIRFFSHIAAACLVVLVSSVLYVNYNRNQLGKEILQVSEYIVGSELGAEDIQLISNEKTTSFEKNINIEINNRGVAEVESDEKNIREINIKGNTLNKLIVPYGKRSTIVLADGTKVWLNSGTILEFPGEFTDKKREIFLTSGEIYIEVAPDKQKSFYVHTADFGVKVYGTKFNLSTYTGSPSSVVLVEGSISLLSETQDEVMMEPNEQVLCTDVGTFDRQKVDVNTFISWKNGYLTFQNTPIVEVLQRIERYYNVSFNYDKEGGLKGLTCSGKIILSENLDNVMTTIAVISDTKYIKDKNQIYILNANN